MQALVVWVNDSLCNVRVKVKYDFYDTDFTVIKMNDTVDEAYIQYLYCNTKIDVSTLEKFSYKK